MPVHAVLEVGGTHVTGALVDTAAWRVVGTPVHAALDAQGTAAAILHQLVTAGTEGRGDTEVTGWAVAMPDPFDYPAGIGRFHGVAKFEALDGVDVGAALTRELPDGKRGIVFCNDADAFAVGAWLARRDAHRVVGMTLGTGVGTGWADRGEVVDPGVPPGGRAHLLYVDGGPLEDSMSRRAIRRAYAAAAGDHEADVREIADRARGGEQAAQSVLAHALQVLGRALAGPIHDFATDLLVVGGSMAASWQLFEPWFREGAGDVPLPPTDVAVDAAGAPLLGAAYVAVSRSR